MTEFRVHPDVLARRVGEEVVLVHSGRNEVFSLNATGARFWELLSDGRSRSEAVEQLTAEFDVTRVAAEEEANRLLAMLEHENLVEREQ
jgi:Coenzyme PQQ synthesis protein D (PqqD)